MAKISEFPQASERQRLGPPNDATRFDIEEMYRQRAWVRALCQRADPQDYENCQNAMRLRAALNNEIQEKLGLRCGDCHELLLATSRPGVTWEERKIFKPAECPGCGKVYFVERGVPQVHLRDLEPE